MIAGLTRFVTRGHVARARAEATAWQMREVVEQPWQPIPAWPERALKVDGGMVGNELRHSSRPTSWEFL